MLKMSLISTCVMMCLVSSAVSKFSVSESDAPTVFTETRSFSKDVRALSRKITVSAGSSFIIELAGNPTTGYMWSNTNPAELTVLTAADPKGQGVYIPRPQPKGHVGGGGSTRFSFTANEVGLEQLEFVYKQPWMNEALFRYTVQVTIK